MVDRDEFVFRVFLGFLVEDEGGDIPRDGVAARGENETRSGAKGLLSVFVDVVADPVDFAGDVAVIGPVFDAAVDDVVSIDSEGPDHCDDDLGLGSHVPHLLQIIGVDDQHR